MLDPPFRILLALFWRSDTMDANGFFWAKPNERDGVGFGGGVGYNNHWVWRLKGRYCRTHRIVYPRCNLYIVGWRNLPIVCESGNTVLVDDVSRKSDCCRLPPLHLRRIEHWMFGECWEAQTRKPDSVCCTSLARLFSPVKTPTCFRNSHRTLRCLWRNCQTGTWWNKIPIFLLDC